jgi:hypothetical protein
MPANATKLSEFPDRFVTHSAGRTPQHQRAVGGLDLQRPKYPEPHAGSVVLHPAAEKSKRPYKPALPPGCHPATPRCHSSG